MAFGSGEDPARSVTTHLDAVDYPAWREQLARVAADNGATVDVINLLKALPRARYLNRDEVLRDLAEASRRFGMGNIGTDDSIRDRSNIGRDLVERASGRRTRHP